MTAAQRLAEMPAWPILMNAATGALYLEISEGSFLGLMRRKGVRPVDLGASVVRWRRSDLDTLVGALPARGAGVGDEPPAVDFESALNRSAQRATRRRSGRGTSSR